MVKRRTLSRTIGVLTCLLPVGCGFVGLDLNDSNQDDVQIGDGDGDAKIGDGDGDAKIGDGDGDGDADGDGDPSTGGTDGAGGSSATGGKSSTGGSDGTGGDEGSGGLNNGTGGFSLWEPLLYHDFEGGLPGTPTTAATASLIHTTGNYHWGGGAMLTMQESGSTASVSMTFGFPDKAYQKLYLRAWLHVSTDALVSTLDLFRFESASSEVLTFGIESSGRVFARTVDSSTAVSSLEASFPYGKWFCFRAEALVSETAGTLKVLVENALVVTSNEGDTRPGDGITHFSYGILATGGTTAGLAVHFDDVTVDDQPIDCEMAPIIVTPPFEEPL